MLLIGKFNIGTYTIQTHNNILDYISQSELTVLLKMKIIF